jgi:hypothetical protein
VTVLDAYHERFVARLVLHKQKVGYCQVMQPAKQWRIPAGARRYNTQKNGENRLKGAVRHSPEQTNNK